MSNRMKRQLTAAMRRDRRLILVQVLIMSLVATLLVRAAWMQVAEGSNYRNAASGNSVREIVTPAQRGLIVDQNGRPLVANRASLTITVDRNELGRQKDGGTKVLTKLGKQLGVSYEDLVNRMKPCGTEGALKQPLCWNGSPNAPVEVANDVSQEVGLGLMEQSRAFPGIRAELRPARSFPKPFGARTTHVSGYLGKVTEDELKEIPEDDPRAKIELIGRSGLESQYDEVLRGTPGVQRVGVTRNGGIANVLEDTPAGAGSNLVTNLDAHLQGITEKALADAVKDAQKRGLPADSGAIVVSDVNTGRVLASASAPTYEPEVWVGGIKENEYKKLTDAKKGTPLLDHVVGGLYPPASTFKVIPTAAGLKSGMYSTTGSYSCPSYYSVGGQRFHNYEAESHGSISLSEALAVSCDTIFYQMAHKMWKADGGLKGQPDKDELILNMARGFGLARKTGIDVPGESTGRLVGRQARLDLFAERRQDYCKRAKDGYPEVEPQSQATLLQSYAKDFCAEGDQFRAGDALNAAIGQGDTLASPIQMNTMYAAIANGGTIYKPQVARAVVGRDGQVERSFEPEEVGKLPIDSGTVEYLKSALAKTTISGTSHNAFLGFPHSKINVAAKTGTGEVAGKKSTAWFASFAPYDKPQFAVTCVVSQGGTGAETCGPAVRKIYEAIFGITGSKVDPAKSVLGQGAAFGDIPSITTEDAELGAQPSASPSASPSDIETLKPSSTATPGSGSSGGSSPSPSNPGSFSTPRPLEGTKPSSSSGTGRESNGRFLP